MDTLLRTTMISLGAAGVVVLVLAAGRSDTTPVRGNAAEAGEAKRFLDDLQRRAFDYFWNEASPRTGLVKDRAGNVRSDSHTVASIAATGFGLAALPVGVERGWISRAQGRERARLTLGFLLRRMPHHHGWFYHFVDMHSGERVWKCELSSIDTALLMAGVLVTGRYFRGIEVQGLAHALYDRVDFRWMLTDGGVRPREKLLSHGWKPEVGFLENRWASFDESPILYVLALGSPTHPIPAESWYAWARPAHSYSGYRGVGLDLPLFVHQYPHCYVDFRGRRDRRGLEPWKNSVTATKMNRQFCIDHAAEFAAYGALSWGLSACDGPDGYRAYAPARGLHDGTLSPWAVAASIPFAPDLCLPTLLAMKRDYGAKVWGRYGFADAYNPGRDWWDPEVIGIDLGAALLMVENHRTGRIWREFMAVPAIRTALHRAGM